MKKLLVLSVFLSASAYTLNGASCTLKGSLAQDTSTQFAFNLCVAMLANNPAIAQQGASQFQATASATQDISDACTWCQIFVQGAKNNSGGMTGDFYDPYSSTYGNLTQINYQALPAILNDAGVFAFINQGAQQKEAFISCFVNQCGVRQAPNTTDVKDCAVGCIALAQKYLAWLAQQSIAATYMPQFTACAVDRGCWNNGPHAFGCFNSCALQQKPLKPTAVPWITSQ